ncbi:MAG: SdrD B-like domain-containing protein, partial [Bacteroidota bacterium]
MKRTFTTIVKDWRLVIVLLILLNSCNQIRQDQSHEALSFLPSENSEGYLVNTENYTIDFEESKITISTPDGKAGNLGIVDTKVSPILTKHNNNSSIYTLQYEDAFEGIDLLFYDKGDGNAGYDLIIEAGADPASISFNIEGYDAFHITETGELALDSDDYQVLHSKPYTYQTLGGTRVEIESQFTLEGNQLGFELGEYDVSYPLIIDPKISVKNINPSVSANAAMMFAPCDGSSLGGRVFQDNNLNGVEDTDEVGQQGVEVAVYAVGNSTPVATATSDANGDWSVANSGFTYPVRVEFSIPNSLTGVQPSFSGAENETEVQFVAERSCEVSYGVIDASAYCDDDPLIAVVCFSRSNDPDSEPTIVFVETSDARLWPGPGSNVDSDGRWGIPAGSSAGNYPLTVQALSNKGEVNTTFGMDWDLDNQRLITGSYRRAYAPMNTNGSTNGFAEAALYQIPVDIETQSAGTPSVWLDLEDLFGDGFAGAHTDDMGFPGPNEFGRTGLNPDDIGFTGLGSIKMAADNSELYVVNLNTREVLVIPIAADGSAPTQESDIKRFPLPETDCGGSRSDGIPLTAALGLGVHPESGRVYATVTCTGPTLADVTGLVYSFDPSDNTPAASDFSLELSIPLDINRPATSPNTNSFWGQIDHEWETVTPNSVFYPGDPRTGGGGRLPNERNVQHIHPWLGEVGFAREDDGDYSMVIAERNRYHDIIISSFYVAGGVMYRACGSEGSWALENNGVCGDATSVVNYSFSANRAGANTSAQNRFFRYVGREGSMIAGTLVIPKGSQEVIVPSMDNLFSSATSG